MANDSNICPKCGKRTLYQCSSVVDEVSGEHPLEFARQEVYLCVNENCRARFLRKYKPDFYNVREKSFVPNWMKKKFCKKPPAE